MLCHVCAVVDIDAELRERLQTRSLLIDMSCMMMENLADVFTSKLPQLGNKKKTKNKKSKTEKRKQTGKTKNLKKRERERWTVSPEKN